MSKSNINFKQIRKKVLNHQNDENIENIPVNPISKVSFRGIKQNKEAPPTQLIDSAKKGVYMSPIRINSTKAKPGDASREDCNKFSILLESKGYSNCNSGRKKSMEISFRSICNANSQSKTRLNTQRKQNDCLVTNFGEYKLKPQINEANYKINNQKQKIEIKGDLIQQKCRQIKQKPYMNFRQNMGELNSLNKLKNKLISPLKKKTQSQPEPVQRKQQKIINIFEHESILSQHDLVNMSKTNDSIDFDMSPCL